MSIKRWWGKINPIRVGWGTFYLIVGLFLLVLRNFTLNFFDWIRSHWVDLSWIGGWSSIGMEQDY